MIEAQPLIATQPCALYHRKRSEPAAFYPSPRHFPQPPESATSFGTIAPSILNLNTILIQLSRATHAIKSMLQSRNMTTTEDELSGRTKRRRIGSYNLLAFQRQTDAAGCPTERDYLDSAVGNLSSRSSSCAPTASPDSATPRRVDGAEQVVCFGMVG